MALHAPFAKQVSVKNMKRQRTFSCWERISSKMFGSGNSVANTNSVDESETLEDGLVIGPAAAAGTVSEIVIQNGTEGEADHHPGLQLTSVSREEARLTFYRHVLSSKTNGPGIKMKLKNGDEIIMFSGNFVITTPHEDLLKQFYNLKVDGQSTFVMMIRRKKKSGEWKWLELFVILSSCNGCCNLTVTKKRAHKKMEFESYHIYKVPGTQRYVQIDNSGLCAKTLSGDSGDKTKVICKRTIFYDDDNGLRSEVTLRGITLGRHISFCVENQQIILSDKPHRFTYGLLGDKAHFMSTEGFFLGYDYDVHEMTLQKKEFAFEELPVPDHLQYQLL